MRGVVKRGLNLARRRQAHGDGRGHWETGLRGSGVDFEGRLQTFGEPPRCGANGRGAGEARRGESDGGA